MKIRKLPEKKNNLVFFWLMYPEMYSDVFYKYEKGQSGVRFAGSRQLRVRVLAEAARLSRPESARLD